MARKTAAPAPAASAQGDAPAFQFGDAEVPAQTRVSTVVNPLLSVCKGLAKDFNAEEGRSNSAKTVTAANDEQAKKIKRWLALAGKELGVTFRSVQNDKVLTFWAVTRITHDRKPKN